MFQYLTPLFDPKSILLYVTDEARETAILTSATLLNLALAEGEFAGSITRFSTTFSTIFAATQKSFVTGNATGQPQTERPDLALIAVGDENVVAALTHAAESRVRAAIVYDTAESHIEALKEIADKHGIHLLGPGSSGLQRPYLKLNACIAGSLGGSLRSTGNLALVSQSGALTAAMLDWAESNAVSFSAVIAPGRSAALDIADVLDFLAQDAHTQSIVMYMEGVRNGRRFMSALRAAARAKPVIVLKAGRRERGKQAALTHSGTMIGGDDVFDAALQRAGAVRVDSFVQLFSAAKCLASRYKPVGNRLGVIGNGGGPGVLAADYAYLRGVDIPALSAATLAKLKLVLPQASSLDNPVDLGEYAVAADFIAAAEVLAASADVDGVLVVVTPKPGIDIAGIARAATASLPGVYKPIIGCWMGETRVRETRRMVNAAGLPVFRLPEAAVDAFANIASFYRNQQMLMQTPPPWNVDLLDNEPDIASAKKIINDVLNSHRQVLTETESKELLAAFRIPVTATKIARTADEAVLIAEKMGFPVVIKINSPDIAHKTDVGGVMLNVRTAQQIRTVFADMLVEVAHRAPGANVDGVALQPMVTKRNGRELYVGMTTDEIFGPVITFGAGGTMIEVIDDRAVALPPLNQFLARRLIEHARSAAVLGEWRGMPPANVEALEYLLLRVSEMICELPELQELDINPLILDEAGAAVVDARMVVKKIKAVTCAPYDLAGESAAESAGESTKALPYKLPCAQPYAHMAILPYPAEFTRDLESKGIQYQLRAIRPEDAEALQNFARNLSSESRYFRFLSTMAELSPSMLARFTQIDYDREIAIVATTANVDDKANAALNKIIGVARYLLNPDAITAEFALVVADDYQGKGIGSELMQQICDIARARGLQAVIGLVLARNTDMLALMTRLGFVEHADPDDADMRRVVLTL